MPDLSGQTYEEAKTTMEGLGLYLELGDSGTEGKVFSQTVEPGVLLDVGTAVEVKFSDNTDEAAAIGQSYFLKKLLGGAD